MSEINIDDILRDTSALFGGESTEDDQICYGSLLLTIAPKEGKANTLLADHLFSPSLLLAEAIETGLISVSGKSELGAGCALPSLLCTTLGSPPFVVTITDYPDETIMENLRNNVTRNKQVLSPNCHVYDLGYEWGQDVSSLLKVQSLTPSPLTGYDVVILSDLLHFDASHEVLILSLVSLLSKSEQSRCHVTAGKYTPALVCDNFLRKSELQGLVWEEREVDQEWRGGLEVKGGGLDKTQLGIRKGNCRWWVGKWGDFALSQR